MGISKTMLPMMDGDVMMTLTAFSLEEMTLQVLLYSVAVLDF